MSDQPDKGGWLSRKAAEGQRILGREALEKPPGETPHFEAFLDMMRDHVDMSGCNTFLDVGCGVGYYAKLLDAFLPELTYLGCDVSPHMIEFAKKDYGRDRFFVCDVMDLCVGADIILGSSIVEVCPNWREVLQHLLKRPFRWLLLNRTRVFNRVAEPTLERTYTTIYGTESFEVVHNLHELTELIQRGGSVVADALSYQVEPETSLICLLVEKQR